MSRAHREILHQARLLGRLSDGLRPNEAEPYLIRDAQRIIESIESLVHIHNAQEEDIYEHAAARLGLEASSTGDRAPKARDGRGASAFERALESASGSGWRWRMLAGAFTLLVLVAGGVYWRGEFFARFRPGAPLAERELSEIKIVGVVSGETETPITASVSGVIAAVSCDIGSIVKAGQVCAKIDARPYRLKVERSNADLSLANGLLTKAKAQLARAQATYERNRNPSNRKAITASALAASRKILEQRQAEVVRAEASVAMIVAALSSARGDLERTSILSPIEGTVVARDIRTGQAVVAGHPLFRVVDPRIVKIRVSVDGRVADALRVGDAVSFSIEREPDHPFEGQVTQISIDPRATEPSRKYDVVVTAANPDLRLVPGMSTTIRMTTSSPGGSRRPATT